MTLPRCLGTTTNALLTAFFFDFVYMQALWQLLWVLTNKQSSSSAHKPGSDAFGSRRMFSYHVFQQFVSKSASRLLAEVCSYSIDTD